MLRLWELYEEGWSLQRLRDMVAGVVRTRSEAIQLAMYEEHLNRDRHGRASPKWTQSVSALQSEKLEVRWHTDVVVHCCQP